MVVYANQNNKIKFSRQNKKERLNNEQNYIVHKLNIYICNNNIKYTVGN